MTSKIDKTLQRLTKIKMTQIIRNDIRSVWQFGITKQQFGNNRNDKAGNTPDTEIMREYYEYFYA